MAGWRRDAAQDLDTALSRSPGTRASHWAAAGRIREELSGSSPHGDHHPDPRRLHVGQFLRWARASRSPTGRRIPSAPAPRRPARKTSPRWCSPWITSAGSWSGGEASVESWIHDATDPCLRAYRGELDARGASSLFEGSSPTPPRRPRAPRVRLRRRYLPGWRYVPDRAPGDPRRRRVRRLLVGRRGRSVLIPSLLFLGRYADHGNGKAPAGSDTPQHVWRSPVVAGLGLEALPAVEGGSQACTPTRIVRGSRSCSPPSGRQRRGVRELAYVLPAVPRRIAGRRGARRPDPGVPGWGAALAGMATGASVQVASPRTATSTSSWSSPCPGAGRAPSPPPAAARGAPSAARRRPASCTGSSRSYSRGSWGSWRSPVSPRPSGSPAGPLAETPSGRVGTTVAVGAGLGVGGLLSAAPRIPRAADGVRSRNDGRPGQARSYRLPATAVAAVGGASLFGPEGGSRRRRAAWLLGAWALLPAVQRSAAGAGRTGPVQRTLSFALAIPVLGALGVAAPSSGCAAEGRRRRRAVVAVLALSPRCRSPGRPGGRGDRGAGRRLAEFPRSVGISPDESRRWSSSTGRNQCPGSSAPSRSCGGSGRSSHPLTRLTRRSISAIPISSPRAARPSVPTSWFSTTSRETWRVVRSPASGPVVVIGSTSGRLRPAVVRIPSGRRMGGWPSLRVPRAGRAPRAPPRPTPAPLLAWWASSLAVVSPPAPVGGSLRR